MRLVENTVNLYFLILVDLLKRTRELKATAKTVDHKLAQRQLSKPSGRQPKSQGER